MKKLKCIGYDGHKFCIEIDYFNHEQRPLQLGNDTVNVCLNEDCLYRFLFSTSAYVKSEIRFKLSDIDLLLYLFRETERDIAIRLIVDEENLCEKAAELILLFGQELNLFACDDDVLRIIRSKGSVEVGLPMKNYKFSTKLMCSLLLLSKECAPHGDVAWVLQHVMQMMVHSHPICFPKLCLNDLSEELLNVLKHPNALRSIVEIKEGDPESKVEKSQNKAAAARAITVLAAGDFRLPREHFPILYSFFC